MNNMPPQSRRSRSLYVRTPLLAFLGICMLAVLLPASSAAQTPGSAPQIIDVAHQPGGPMTVTFQANNPSLQSLDVLVDGEPVPYEVIESATTAPSLILAIENSASMTSDHRAQIQSAALSLIDALGASTQVAVVSFGDGTEIAQPFTTEHNTLSSTITALTTAGGAALYSGVETAAGLAVEASGETLIVLITYGWEWGGLSTTTRETSLAAVQASGVPVYVQSMVLSGEDVTYLSALPVDGAIHNLAQLPALADAASLLGGNAIAQHTLRIDSSVLTLGEHTLRLDTPQGSATTTIRDAGLITLATVEPVSDGQPIQITAALNSELAATTLIASFEGAILPAGDNGAFSVDPWQFSPGDAALQISAVLDGATIARADTTVTIPALEPILSTATSDDGATLLATVRAQPGTVSKLFATIEGEVAATASAPTLQLEVPPEGNVSIEALAADGTVLASLAVANEVAPRLIPEDTGTGASYRLIVAGLLSLAIIAALVVLWRRRSGPTLQSIPWTTTDSAATSTSPPPAHTPVQLHPVGNWEIMIARHGDDPQRLLLGPGAISIGASPLCDITIDNDDVRFVHAVIGRDGPQLRIHRFGPVIMDGRALKSEDSALSPGTTLAIGDTLITVGGHAQIHDGAVAA